MPTISDNAVCIRRWDFSETSQTVSLFTQQHGIIRGLAKGSKREKGNFSGGFDVLTLGNIVAIIKPGRDLATLTEWDLQNTCRHLRSSLDANRNAMYMADLIHHMLTDHDPHPNVYTIFTKTLEQMRESKTIGLSLLAFQLNLLSESGYEPILDRDAQTGQDLSFDEPTLAFSALAGGTVADDGGSDRWRVRTETIQLMLDVIQSKPISDPNQVESIERANRLLAAYTREIIGTEPAAFRWRFPDLSG